MRDWQRSSSAFDAHTAVARRTDVDEVEGEERDRANMRVTSVGAAAEGLAREERVLQVLAERTAETVGDLQATLVSPGVRRARNGYSPRVH